MTVHELITALQDCDQPDSDVRVSVAGGRSEISEVYYKENGTVILAVDLTTEAK